MSIKFQFKKEKVMEKYKLDMNDVGCRAGLLIMASFFLNSFVY